MRAWICPARRWVPGTFGAILTGGLHVMLSTIPVDISSNGN